MTNDQRAAATSGTRVEVAPGTGWLAHRAGALLWSPEASRPDAVLAAFLAAADAESTRAAVTAVVVDAALAVPAFALVTWSPHVHVVVMGAVEVETDAPSLPLLSGATSRTWVEHGLPGATGSVVVRAGTAPGDGTAAGPGVVRAGGFLVTVLPGPVAEPVATTVPVAPAEPEPPVAEAPAAAPASGAALLDLVTGGDWMDDSIGISAPGALLAQDAEPEPEPVPEFDDGRPTVRGRRCPAGHANSPTRATCQWCGDLVDLAAPVVDVAQPVLAELIGDDGTVVPILGPVIVGRNPDPTAAGLDVDAARLVLPERAGVSRTHLVVRVDGWTVTATDCGSRRGTELVRDGGEPLRLEPWTAHEVLAGDELFLGGPTSIRVNEPFAGDSSPSPR